MKKLKRALLTAIASQRSRRCYAFLGKVFKKPTKAATELLLSGRLGTRKREQKNWFVTCLRLLSVCFAAALLVATLPIWLTGEIFEISGSFVKRAYEHDEPLSIKPLDQVALDTSKTKYLNFPISTYQYSSNRDFCENSDWGKYSKKHFNEANQTDHLGPWHGIDILEKKGLELICQKSIDAGANSIRFSVEWADIEKTEGHYDIDAMQSYVNIAKTIRSKGLEPMVVLHHFVTPLDKEGRNVFESPESVDRFVNFATFVYQHLKDDVSVFFTFNEPNVQSIGNYILGMFPMKGIAKFSLCRKVMKHMLQAHKKVFLKLHKLSGEREIKIGLTHSATCFVPSSRWNFMTRIVKFSMTHLFHDRFMGWLKRNTDFVDLLGIQFYSRPYIGGILPKSTCRDGEIMLDEMQYRFDPEGLLPVLRDINSELKGKVDLFISETGIPGENTFSFPSKMDDLRELYFKIIALGVRKAQDEGIPVIGMAPWALFSNFEWEKGYSVDFGNIVRDPKTSGLRETKGYQAIKTVFFNSSNKTA